MTDGIAAMWAGTGATMREVARKHGVSEAVVREILVKLPDYEAIVKRKAREGRMRGWRRSRERVKQRNDKAAQAVPAFEGASEGRRRAMEFAWRLGRSSGG